MTRLGITPSESVWEVIGFLIKRTSYHKLDTLDPRNNGHTSPEEAFDHQVPSNLQMDHALGQD